MNLFRFLWSKPEQEQGAGAVHGFRIYLHNLVLQSAENPGPILEQLHGLRRELNTLIEWLEQEAANRKREPQVRRELLVKCQAKLAEEKETPCA